MISKRHLHCTWCVLPAALIRSAMHNVFCGSERFTNTPFSQEISNTMMSPSLSHSLTPCRTCPHHPGQCNSLSPAVVPQSVKLWCQPRSRRPRELCLCADMLRSAQRVFAFLAAPALPPKSFKEFWTATCVDHLRRPFTLQAALACMDHGAYEHHLQSCKGPLPNRCI